MSTVLRRRQRWWSRPAGIKMRSALGSAAVVAAAVTLAGLGLIYTVQLILGGNVDDTATQRSNQVVAAMQEHDQTLLDQTLQSPPGDQAVVQILDATGHVIAGSPQLQSAPPITSLRPKPGETLREQSWKLWRSDEQFHIVAVGVMTSDGPRIVVVAQSLYPLIESIELITTYVGVGIPLLALIVGLATFWFTRRSLRPVEAIRTQVALITSRDLHARVPVPDARDEVAALANTMNAMLDRLETAARTQRRFVADASHELRSPLATLQIGLEVAAQADTPQRHQLQRLQGQAERLSRLTSDLLLLAQLDEHTLSRRRADVDIDDLVYSHRDRIGSAYPAITIKADVRPARVLGDRDQLSRAIGNLCDNAARHAQSQIALTVEAHDHTVFLSVDDDGPGIPEAERRHVFERFARLDGSRARHDGGAGLGLAITHEIVTGHGGTIFILDSDLGGASIQVKLPMLAGFEA